MSYATKSQVNSIVSDVKAEINRDIHHGHINPVVCHAVPAVFVARISANRYHVQWNYQPVGADVGDIATVPHPEDYTEQPHIHAILKDGMWHQLFA